MEKPSYQQVFEEFNKKLCDSEVSKLCAERFCIYNEGCRDVMGQWTVKYKGKRHVMKNWQLAVNTFIRNMPKYSKDLVVKLERNKLFKAND